MLSFGVHLRTIVNHEACVFDGWWKFHVIIFQNNNNETFSYLIPPHCKPVTLQCTANQRHDYFADICFVWVSACAAQFGSHSFKTTENWDTAQSGQPLATQYQSMCCCMQQHILLLCLGAIHINWCAFHSSTVAIGQRRISSFTTTWKSCLENLPTVKSGHRGRCNHWSKSVSNGTTYFIVSPLLWERLNFKKIIPIFTCNLKCLIHQIVYGQPEYKENAPTFFIIFSEWEVFSSFVIFIWSVIAHKIVMTTDADPWRGKVS